MELLAGAFVAALACASGCNAILGFTEPDLAPIGLGGAGGAAATGGSAGSGGAGGSGGVSVGGSSAGGGGGSTATGPHCAGLPATCGPGEDEDCCASQTVVGGSYSRSYDGIDHGNSSHGATVGDFALDRFEVTVGRFRAFVDAGMGTQSHPPGVETGANPAITDSGWFNEWNDELAATTAALRADLACSAAFGTWTDAPGANELRPMNCVSWYEAFAFCAWDGGRLPTEAEWNYAAAGGSQHRFYAWSDPYPPGSTTVDPTYAVYRCTGDGSAVDVCHFNDILTVGSRSPQGDGRWGHADIGGSMWEWNLDWYSPAYPDPCIDCANLQVASRRVRRGGSFTHEEEFLRTAHRVGDEPYVRGSYVGLRCARVAP